MKKLVCLLNVLVSHKAASLWKLSYLDNNKFKL